MLTRNRNLIILISGIAVSLYLLYVLRTVLFPILLGLVMADILLPPITWLEKRLPRQGKFTPAKRSLLILFSFLVILLILGAFSFFIIRGITNAFTIILPNIQLYFSAGLLALQGWAETFRQEFPPEMQQQFDRFLLETGELLANAIRSTFVRSFSFIPGTFNLVFGFGVLPFFLFYVLKDSEKLKSDFYSSLSPRLAEHARNIASIISRVTGQYVRAQLVLGFIVAYFSLVGLLILGINFSFALAAIAGITELIPVLGPWIGGAIAVMVTLAIAPEKAIWVALLYFLIQILENNLLVPRIQGAYLHLHPAILIVLLALGAYVAGFWGIILVAPLAATIVEIYKYSRRCAEQAVYDSREEALH